MWPQLVYALVMMVVSAAISLAMQEKPKAPTAGTLDIPTAEAGGNIAVVFGTVRLKQTNVVWFGNQEQVAIRQKGGKK